MQKFMIFTAFFLVAACSKTIHVANTKVSGYEIEARSISPDPDVASLIAPYKEALDQEMNQVIGVAAERMEKGRPESSLGNWVADVIHEMASEKTDRKIDFAIQNYGGIRVGSVSPGPITRGEIFELMPFDNLVTIIEMPGPSVDSLVQRFATSGGWPVSEELRFRIKNRKPVSVEIGGEPLAMDRTYFIAMPDYIANGGDRMNFLKGLPRQDLDYLIRDALIDYIIREAADGKDIRGVTDGRITISED